MAWINVSSTLQKETSGSVTNYRFNLGAAGFFNLSDDQAAAILVEANARTAADEAIIADLNDEIIRATNSEALKMNIADQFESRYIPPSEFTSGVTITGLNGIAGEDYYIRDETTGALLFPVTDYTVISTGFTLVNPVGVGVTVTGKLGTLINYVAKVDLLTKGSNLFNKSADTAAQGTNDLTGPAKIIPNTFRSLNGTDTASTDYSVYGPIPLTPGQSLTFSNNGVTTGEGRFRFITVYKADGTHIEGTPGGTNTAGSTFTLGAAVGSIAGAYVYVTFFNTAADRLQIQRGINATTYQPFYGDANLIQPQIKIFGDSLKDSGNLLYRQLANKITPEDADFFERTNQLFNINDPLNSTGLFQSNGVIVTSTINMSWYIPVKPSTSYTVSPRIRQIGYFAFADSMGWVSRNDANTSDVYTFTTPSNVRFIRVCYATSYGGSLMLQEGSSFTGYEDYGYLMSALIYPINGGGGYVPPDPPAYLKWAQLGDSITAQAMWQTLVSTTLYLTGTNLGISGTKMSGANADSMWQDARINAIPLDTDLLDILAGTNDWAQSALMGDIDSTDTNTYMGAYNVAMQKIVTRIPLAKIFIMGVTFAHYPPSGRTDTGTPWVSATRNELGYSTDDYAASAKLIADKWGAHFIETNNLCWNPVNYLSFTPDKVHVNAAGGKRMSLETINEMNFRLR